MHNSNIYYKGIRQCSHSNVSAESGTTYCLSYGLRAVSDSDIVYTSYNLDRIYDW